MQKKATRRTENLKYRPEKVEKARVTLPDELFDENMNQPHFGSRTTSKMHGTVLRFLALRTHIAAGVPLIGDLASVEYASF